jgi:hypothetical protein
VPGDQRWDLLGLCDYVKVDMSDVGDRLAEG